MSDNKDQNALVEVTLDQDRMYRAKDSDTVAITVKAGVPTKVPYWVAEAWGVVKEDTPIKATEKASAKPSQPPTKFGQPPK